MRYIFSALIALFFFLLSVLEWRAHALFSEAEHSSASSVVSGLSGEVVREIRAGQEATSLPLALSKSFEQLFWTYRRVAGTEPNPQRQIELYCEALASLGRALELDPVHAVRLSYWADLRSVLGDFQCEQPLTEGEPREVIDFAISRQPMSMNVTYIAGVAALESGRRSDAHKHFHRVLSFATSLSPLRRQVIFDSIHSPEDLLRVVPAQFPQALQWARFFEREDYERRHLEWREAFDQLLFESFLELRTRYTNEQLSFEEYYTRVLGYDSVFHSDRMRRAFDFELSKVLQAQTLRLNNPHFRQLAPYMAMRSELERIEVVPAIALEDTRPEATALYLFGYEEAVSLRHFPHSIGFFVPENRMLSALELHVPAEPRRGFAIDRLRVLTSVDNRRFVDVSRNFLWREYEFRGRRIFSSTLQVPERLQFVKILIERDVSDAPMSIDIRSALRVYGPLRISDNELLFSSVAFASEGR